MIFCCTSANSSKKRNSKSINKQTLKIDEFYEYLSYRTDSGFSENNSSEDLTNSIEQIVGLEKSFSQKLTNFIGKYSRPLRRYLTSEEIVDIFQNIEKISKISQSLIRQCQTTSHFDDFLIYQTWSKVIIDSYSSYILQFEKARRTFELCQKKISFSLQLPNEFVVEEIGNFLDSPLRHISALSNAFNVLFEKHPELSENFDRNFLRDLKSIDLQAKRSLEKKSLDTASTDVSSEDLTFLSETSSVFVLKRVNKGNWESKRVELLNSRLVFTSIDRSTITSSVFLSNIVHFEKDRNRQRIKLVLLRNGNSKMAKTYNLYLQFEPNSNFDFWVKSLSDEIQQAKDKTWQNNNQILI